MRKSVIMIVALAGMAGAAQAQNLIVRNGLDVKSLPASETVEMPYSGGSLTIGGESYSVEDITLEAGTSSAPFVLEVSDVSKQEAVMRVSPLSDSNAYFATSISRQYLEWYHENSVKKYMENIFSDTMWGDMTKKEIFDSLKTVGAYVDSLSYLDVGAEYVAFAVGLDEDGNITTDTLVVPFTTEGVVSENTFKVTFDAIDTWGAAFTITPSNDDSYYYTIVPASYAESCGSDEELLDAVVQLNSFLIPWYATSGVQEVANDSLLYTDRGYELVVFGYDLTYYVPSTKIYRFPFRTAKSDVDISTTTFTANATDIGPRSATVTVTPSNNDAMYYWDVIPDYNYEKYKGDMNGYANLLFEYVGLDALLENGLLRGVDEYSYSYNLDPATKFYVWAVCLNEDGSFAGDVQVVDSFTTEEARLSTVKAELSFDKYYDGTEVYDALHETSSWAYPESIKGSAYVPVTMVKIGGDSIMRTKAIIAQGDLTDMSDDDLVYGLDNQGTNWEGTMRFSVPYDTEVTLLAVAQDRDGNYGPVFKYVTTFTKDGISPVSDLTGGSSARPSAAQKRVAARQAICAYRTVKK